MKKLILIVAMAIAPALFINGAYAQKPAVVASEKPGWHKIAETTADFKTDKDEIMVLGNDMFKALKLKVTNAPIHIYKMTVMYETGADEEVSTDEIPGDMTAGSESKVINLKGADRDIKKVVFMYRTPGHNKAIDTKVDMNKDNPVDVKVHDKAHVELWGLK
jgi:hypothetical protein